MNDDSLENVIRKLHDSPSSEKIFSIFQSAEHLEDCGLPDSLALWLPLATALLTDEECEEIIYLLPHEQEVDNPWEFLLGITSVAYKIAEFLQNKEEIESRMIAMEPSPREGHLLYRQRGFTEDEADVAIRLARAGRYKILDHLVRYMPNWEDYQEFEGEENGND